MSTLNKQKALEIHNLLCKRLRINPVPDSTNDESDYIRFSVYRYNTLVRIEEYLAKYYKDQLDYSSGNVRQYGHFWIDVFFITNDCFITYYYNGKTSRL